MKSVILAPLIGLLFVFSGSLAAQNLLTNGSFEDGDYSGGAYETIGPGDTDITGWDVGGAGVDWHNTIEMQFPQDGSLVVDLNLSGGGLSDTGTLSQTFTTEVGKTYVMAFYLAGPGTSFPDPRTVRVSLPGLNTEVSTPASSHDALVWERHELEFTAATVSSTLTFSSFDGSGFWGPLLDNVSVEEKAPAAAPIPTPAQIPTVPAYGLVITALGLMLLAARRFRA